jgi:Putative ATPase subunit of terminase (gpP-like)
MCYNPRSNDEKKAIACRRQTHLLYFEQGWSRGRIAAHLGVSRMFVHRWTQDPARRPEADARGWRKGTGRRWSADTHRRLVAIAEELRADPTEFFTGATAVLQAFRARYPDEPAPPVRTVGRTLTQAGLTRRPRPRGRGAARYLCYPEHTVYTQLGKRVSELDAIGPKFLRGTSMPLFFLGISFKQPPRWRYFLRTADITASTLIQHCATFFDTWERPEVMKVDNGPGMSGSQSAVRTVSRFVQFLLRQQVTPVFAVPRRPFSQASIEGNNSVFARHFWRRWRFVSAAEVDVQLAWFNAASARYSGYTPPPAASRVAFEPKIYFIRQVHEIAPGQAAIHVANAAVALSPVYVNLFVLAEWHLGTQRLTVSLEREQQLECLVQIPFHLHPKTKLDPGIRV